MNKQKLVRSLQNRMRKALQEIKDSCEQHIAHIDTIHKARDRDYLKKQHEKFDEMLTQYIELVSDSPGGSTRR